MQQRLSAALVAVPTEEQARFLKRWRFWHLLQHENYSLNLVINHRDSTSWGKPFKSDGDVDNIVETGRSSLNENWNKILSTVIMIKQKLCKNSLYNFWLIRICYYAIAPAATVQTKQHFRKVHQSDIFLTEWSQCLLSIKQQIFAYLDY